MAPEVIAFLNIIILAGLTIAVPFVLKWGLTILRAAKDKAKTSLSADQWAQLESVTQLLVMAAEQSGLSGRIENEGKVKRAYVLEQLKKYAEDHGFKDLDFDAFDALIEGKVYEVINAPVTPVVVNNAV